jgi:Mlc titration factor MtfA (ptsG expression regulator)
MVDRIEAAIPSNIDPDTPAADPWYALLPLDPYAASDPAEFFAVSTEKFFVDPRALQAEFGGLVNQYQGYFGLDPLKWHL